MNIKEYVSNLSIEWNLLKNSSFFITGGSGLVGSSVIDMLLEVNSKFALGIKIYALIHNTNIEKEGIINIQGSIDNLPFIKDDIDYIIHCASNTSSSYFVENPFDLLKINSKGTIELLEFGKKKNLKRFIFLSSMEVYGYPKKGYQPRESEIAGFNPAEARNSYPLVKTFSETLCFACAKQYGLPVNVLRLTQTFGSKIEKKDERVFAQFTKCVCEGRDIVLKSKGETERSYLHTYDAAYAIIKIILDGKENEVYNVANPDTYCSIYDLAVTFIKNSKKEVSVKIDQEYNKKMYCNTQYMNIDISKISKLGWAPKIGINEMVKDAIYNYR